VAVGILAGLVHVERMVGVLDQRHLQPARDKQRDQVFDQRGLATAGVGGESEYFQGGGCRGIAAGQDGSRRRRRFTTLAVKQGRFML
jgi:hypothetical protein